MPELFSVFFERGQTAAGLAGLAGGSPGPSSCEAASSQPIRAEAACLAGGFGRYIPASSGRKLASAAAGMMAGPSMKRTCIAVAAALLLLAGGRAVGLGAQPVGGAGVKSTPIRPASAGRVGFTLLQPAATGIAFTNHLADASAAENQIRLIGSGVAAGDVDGDGWCDLYLCRLEGPNALYRNRGGWRFEDVTAPAGVACADQYSTGCALADMDGDGDLDLLVNSIGGGTRCFFNDGKGRFTEATESGLARKFCGTSLALADMDGDGDLDLYVANYRTTTVRSAGLTILNVGGQRMIRPEDRDQYEFTAEGLLLEHGEPDILYLNDGRGRFTPVPWTGGNFRDEDGQPLRRPPRDWGLSVMFRDLNGDGAPDLYVCNDFWSADRVWLNDGRGRCRALPRLALRGTSTFSMGVDFADINRDGHDDFLVLDMLSRDHARRMRQRAMLGQSFNNIGKIDDRPQTERNTLFLNRGDGTYAEIAQLGGLQASEWSWSVAFLDVDLDGFEDVLITTGHGFDTQDSDTEARIAAMGPQPAGKFGERLLLFPRLHVPNAAFRNRGDLTFEEVGGRWGFDAAGVSHGLALADLDNDGDADAVVNNLNAAAGIHRNESPAPRVAVRLKGRAPNTRGIGAKVRFLGGPVPQSQEVMAGGRYLSSDEPMRVFAAGKAAGGLRLEVTWRSGTRSVVTNVQPNCVYEIDEAGAALPAAASPSPPSPAPFFTDVSDRLGHTHHEEPFDDFARQPWLSRRLSQLGPGLCWCDVDGDGRDDLFLGSGRGGELSLFRNRADGRFERVRLGAMIGRAADDLTAVLGWSAAPGSATLLVGQANYETGDAAQPAARRYEFWAGGIDLKENLPGTNASPGPLALGDVDGDGDLDLFLGGRVVPGRYPEPPVSRLFRNDGARFALAAEWADLGMVSGAVFSDLTGDGFAELIVACDWGPVRIFRNERGRLTTWDPPVVVGARRENASRGNGETARGEVANSPARRLAVSPVNDPTVQRFNGSTLHDLTGWWNGVTTGDFDNDGRLDFVAANWGHNTPFEPCVKDGLRLVFGDLAGRGAVEAVEAVFDPASARVVPWRDLDRLSVALPWARERFTTCAAYGEASLEQVLGDRLQRSRELRVNWLDSTVFLNRGDHFEARPLPQEAQFAPAFAVCVGDFDGDGNDDLFLSQNFFAVEEQTSRYDAGRGLWLRGDGAGGWQPVRGQESGVLVYGEQRGAALGDFDADGRVDLAVSQNGAATKLYRNAAARPGLRVRLLGPPDNPQGFGAVARLTCGVRAGPARAVHGGSGYWSQDSAVLVLGAPQPPTEIAVRWPGGATVKAAVPSDAREISVDTRGQLKVLR
jgi:hypothetical protein